ncbi:MAG TPA: DEAD/DEAH box helicase [Stellaceae bacterium]|nr:DEAD/DEAH box helicase [Stellaceae bacterium]
MSFVDLGLSTEVLEAVRDAGYETPTPIQEQAIPYVLMGRDVLGCAQTGTGKTAGFTLPMIDILAAGRARARMPRSLILEPTRELAAQVAQSFEVYGKYHKLSMALLIGGESFTDQEKKLDRGVDVLIATPGRLIDLFERGKILLSDVKILVIDEADRMLDMGFIPDVERIVSLIPRIRQTLFFSATMPPEIRRLADAFLLNPKEISVAPPASPAETVSQALLVVGELDKRETLRRLLRHENVKNALIFCNRKRDVDILYRSLAKHDFNVAALHGDMAQSKRTETLERFKNGDVQLLVASDVAARGLDVEGLSHVFNFDVPHHAEDYVHRIGRTGRAGKPGCAYTIATPEDGKAVTAIETLIRKEIPRSGLDDIPALELSMDEGDGRRRRGRGRGRDERGRERGGRPERRRSDRPRERAPAPAPTAEASEPVRVTPLPRVETRPVRPEDGIVAEPGTAGVAPIRLAAQREAAPSRHPRGGENDGRVVGFGDDLPAFLRRPVRIAGA